MGELPIQRSGKVCVFHRSDSHQSRDTTTPLAWTLAEAGEEVRAYLAFQDWVTHSKVCPPTAWTPLTRFVVQKFLSQSLTGMFIRSPFLRLDYFKGSRQSTSDRGRQTFCAHYSVSFGSESEENLRLPNVEQPEKVNSKDVWKTTICLHELF